MDALLSSCRRRTTLATTSTSISRRPSASSPVRIRTSGSWRRRADQSEVCPLFSAFLPALGRHHKARLPGVPAMAGALADRLSGVQCGRRDHPLRLLWPKPGLMLAAFGVMFLVLRPFESPHHHFGQHRLPGSFLLAALLLAAAQASGVVVPGVARVLSLGFKQVDSILVPLFLIAVWQMEKQHRIRALLGVEHLRAGKHVGD